LTRSSYQLVAASLLKGDRTSCISLNNGIAGK
jgi:hypothetical protein